MLAIRTANAGVNTPTVNVMGDGNCFYRAVLVAVRLKNLLAFSMPEEQHGMLRTMVVDFALAGPYEFNIFTTEYETKQAWSHAMYQEGTWADAMAVRACSDMLEIPIQVIINGQVAMSFGDDHYYRNHTTGIDNVIRLTLEMGHYSVCV